MSSPCGRGRACQLGVVTTNYRTDGTNGQDGRLDGPGGSLGEETWTDNTSETVRILDTVGNLWSGYILDLEEFITVQTVSTGSALEGNATTSRDLRLEPPVIKSLSLSLYPTTITGVAGGGTTGLFEYQLWFVDELAPLNYSTALRPGFRDNETALSVVSVEGVTVTQDTRLVIPILTDPATLTAGGTRLESGEDDLRALIADANFSGRVAISLRMDHQEPGIYRFMTGEIATGANTTTANRPLGVAEEYSFHSGHDIGGGHKGRARHDPKSGLPIATKDLVEDGWFEGMYTSVDWRDPADTQGEFDLPDSEGDITDEVGF